MGIQGLQRAAIIVLLTIGFVAGWVGSGVWSAAYAALAGFATPPAASKPANIQHVGGSIVEQLYPKVR